MPKTALRVSIDLTGTGYCVAFCLRKAARAVTQLYDSALQDAGIRSTQLPILIALAKYEPLSVGRLADLTVSDTTTMTRGLQLLQRKGWLTVSARSAKRERRVALTLTGRRLLKRAVARWRRIQQEFVRQLGTRDWERMRTALDRLGSQALGATARGPKRRAAVGTRARRR